MITQFFVYLRQVAVNKQCNGPLCIIFFQSAVECSVWILSSLAFLHLACAAGVIEQTADVVLFILDRKRLGAFGPAALA